ncbi:MAG: bifunctional tRNA (5-methylaminomethyl-2-thiouridine)(34)-methyltransferase MnmD/FAD-dependent 5-carboxymethylaminomethyl-2-thiouridine(34) oxidoreductase MnmC [Pseudomonadales bacterium]|nr:bifunctional tRNA (5-methylaminomethyl-2-thiouridine)(34)-methyltransferase MnmD/FAD-dependent 5-carboxymethylaminomethyl-2-thiouridine(34) oxidoreductase MnmC [Pseudomonadales bacterium]
MRNPTPDLEWDAENLPRSKTFNDIYYSAADALAESDHVFIDGNRLLERWQQAATGHGVFCVGEIGFGAGLNFLNTWHQWNRQPKEQRGNRQLHYIGFEQFPLALSELERLYENWPILSDECKLFLQCYQAASRGWHRFNLAPDVYLDLLYGDAIEELSSRSLLDGKMDAWFVDGFSPKLNSKLWSPELFALLAEHSHTGCTLATYSAAGEVRRGLEAAGFAVTRETGFGNKRHMLTASLNQEAFDSKQKPARQLTGPWFLTPNTGPKDTSDEKHAVIIGAGIAGACCAHALAKRHWQVTVLERTQQIAAGATGIPQLALRLRLFQQANPEALFHLQAYLYAIQLYAEISKTSAAWQQSGVLQLPGALNKAGVLNPNKIAELYPSEIVRLASSAEFPDIKFPDGNNAGYWFPQGGWGDAIAVCESLLGHKRIDLQLNTEVTTLVRDGSYWLALDPGANRLARAPIVIIAAGDRLQTFEQTQELPLQTSPGQSSLVESDNALDHIDFVISGARSIFPPFNNHRTVSASYRQQPDHTETRDEDDAANLHAFNSTIAGSEKYSSHLAGSQVAVRANTPDRVPLVGMAPDIPAMRIQYAGLARNAQQQYSEPGSYHHGLYLSAAHGSTGFTSSPLAGEYLASLITGSCLPLNQQLMNLLNPARFVIQDLKKQRI